MSAKSSATGHRLVRYDDPACPEYIARYAASQRSRPESSVSSRMRLAASPPQEKRMTENVEVVSPLPPLDEIRAAAEADAQRWCPFPATSDWGRRVIEEAGERAVRREYERRARSTPERGS